MKSISEGSLTFNFKDTWNISKYDDWPFYKNQFQGCCQKCKALDIVAISPDNRLWLIEIKDYRTHSRTKPEDLCGEVALKVLHTLAGLTAAKFNKVNDHANFAAKCLNCDSIHVVLHIEIRNGGNRLFNSKSYQAGIKDKLKQLLKPICPHPKVTSMESMFNIDWTVLPSV